MMNELTYLFEQDDFVNATLAQINKDMLGLSTQKIELKSSSSTQSVLHALIENLVPVIKELANQIPEQLSQFIYRVDLPENKYLDSLHADPTLINLAHLIIEREAQKVYFKRTFK